MTRLFAKIFFTTALLLHSCNQIDEKQKQENILKLMNEAGDFLQMGMIEEITDSAKAMIHYRKALNKFFEALAIDKKQKKIGIYIPDLSSKLKIEDSSLYWKEWLGKEYK
jgi:hypothetical protein